MTISLKAARINKGLTQDELASKLGVSKKTICSWENGKTMPNVDKIHVLCDALGVKYDNIRWRV